MQISRKAQNMAKEKNKKQTQLPRSWIIPEIGQNYVYNTWGVAHNPFKPMHYKNAS